jgi:hypothetical protein
MPKARRREAGRPCAVSHHRVINRPRTAGCPRCCAGGMRHSASFGPVDQGPLAPVADVAVLQTSRSVSRSTAADPACRCTRSCGRAGSGRRHHTSWWHPTTSDESPLYLIEPGSTSSTPTPGRIRRRRSPCPYRARPRRPGGQAQPACSSSRPCDEIPRPHHGGLNPLFRIPLGKGDVAGADHPLWVAWQGGGAWSTEIAYSGRAHRNVALLGQTSGKNLDDTVAPPATAKPGRPSGRAD